MRKVGTQGPKAPKSGTPNPDPVRGSDKNKRDAASKPRGYKVSAREESVLQEKSDKFNEEFKSKLGYGSTLGQLKSVFARGMGAFQVSHSPKVSSATQWAYARVNAFLYLMKNGRPKNSGYIQDNDLLPSGHKAKSKLTKNHNRPGDHPQKNGMPVAGKKKLAKLRGGNSKAAKSLKKKKREPEKSAGPAGWGFGKVEGVEVGEFDVVYVRSGTKLFHKNSGAKSKPLTVVGKKSKNVLEVEDDDGNIFNIKLSKMKLFDHEKEKELELKGKKKKLEGPYKKKKKAKAKAKKEKIEEIKKGGERKLTNEEKEIVRDRVNKGNTTDKTKLNIDKAVLSNELYMDVTSETSPSLEPRLKEHQHRITKNKSLSEGMDSWTSISYTEFRAMDRKKFENFDLEDSELEELKQDYESFKLGVRMAPRFKSLDGENIVYRGGSLGARDGKLDNILKAGVGGVISEGAHHSMSRSFDVADGFASASSGVMMRIKTKTGRMVERVSSHDDELEVIGLPETKYRIKGIQEHVFPTKLTWDGDAKAGKNGYRLFLDLEEI